jgi:hypothetical protein
MSLAAERTTDTATRPPHACCSSGILLGFLAGRAIAELLKISELPKLRGSGTVAMCRPSWLAPVNGIGSVAEDGGGAARHTRAWSADAPAVVADCRRLRFVPQPCQM